ncbi:MAG: 16S rRNA (uracil(1498)-N(3))-methyltransferase [Chromatiales bacterium]|nr:16S rRNA (uracil(1498)-N(3))-methyltransferase [Chromatiales bacterium]
MQRPRIYTPEALHTGTTRPLPGPAAVHIARVLRLSAGDPITLFDGTGTDYDAVLKVVARGGVSVEVGTGRPVERESPLAVTLLQGVSRGPRMDTVVQKATELGVWRIQPVLAGRSVVRLDAERGEARRAHWQRIVISACEQCGRSMLPEVLPARSLDEALATLAPGTVGLTLDPGGESGLDRLLGAASRMALAIGPEGGFTEEEIRMLTRAGFRGLRLGPRILRTETAPLAALAILQYAWGDLGS